MSSLLARDFDNTCEAQCPPQLANKAEPECYKCGKSIKESVRFDKAQEEE